MKQRGYTQMQNKFFKTKIAAFLVWTVLILYFSTRKVGGGGAAGTSNAVFEHVFAYSVFALLLFLVLKDSKVNYLYATITLITFVYGFGVEALQIILPWRNFSFFDSMLNLIGGATISILKPVFIFKK